MKRSGPVITEDRKIRVAQIQFEQKSFHYPKPSKRWKPSKPENRTLNSQHISKNKRLQEADHGQNNFGCSPKLFLSYFSRCSIRSHEQYKHFFSTLLIYSPLFKLHHWTFRFLARSLLMLSYILVTKPPYQRPKNKNIENQKNEI